MINSISNKLCVYKILNYKNAHNSHKNEYIVKINNNLKNWPIMFSLLSLIIGQFTMILKLKSVITIDYTIICIINGYIIWKFAILYVWEAKTMHVVSSMAVLLIVIYMINLLLVIIISNYQTIQISVWLCI